MATIHVKSRIVVLIFLLIGSMVDAQSSSNIRLIDSLSMAHTQKEKVNLSFKIADSLKDTDWSRSVYYIHHAQKLAAETGNEALIAKSNYLTAQFYFSKSALKPAVSYDLKAYDFYKNREDSRTKLHIENELAIIYTHLDNKQRALSFFRTVYNSSKELADTLLEAKSLNNLGNLFLAMKADSSRYYFRQSLKLAKKLKNTELQAFVFTNLGRNYGRYEQWDSLHYYFHKALVLVRTKPSSHRTKIWVYKAMANYFFNQNKTDSTLKYAKKVIALVKNKYDFDHQDAVKLIYKSYLHKKKYQKAAHYFQLYDRVHDSLKVDKKMADIVRIALEQDFKNKAKTKALKKSRDQFEYTVIGLSMVLLLFIALSFIIYYRTKLVKVRLQRGLTKAREKELRATIELKNKELASKAMKEVNRSQVEKAVLEKLKGIRRKAVKKETQKAIDQVAHQLRNRNREKVWEEFELSFEKVHTSFFKNLQEKHPDLTPRERRLSALLKLNLSSKEIALINGQTVKSVENARTRLRKKFHLTNTATKLTDYFAQFD